MKIYINDKFIVVKEATKKEQASLKRRFTYDDKSNVFAGGKFDSRKIKKVPFIKFTKEYGFLFSGFLKEFLLFAKENCNIENIEDKRTRFSFQSKITNTRQYFPEHFTETEHQEDALAAMLKTNTGIIKAPTSSGKTEIFIAFIKTSKLKTIVVMDKVSLVEQTRKRIIEAGIKNVGIAHGKKVEDGDVVVSTIQSIRKLLSLTKFKCLIIDECHKSSADTFQDFLYNTNFPLRYGFSATPNSGDHFKWAKIRQYLGNTIYEIDSKLLMEKKVLAKPTIRFTESDGRPTPDWTTAYKMCIAENEDRNNIIKGLVDEYNTSTLILVKHIIHGELLEEILSDSLFLSGKNSSNERQEAIDSFENGDLKVIIATSIFNEGISIDAIRLLVIASGGKSKIETVQRLGRGLRTDKEAGKFNVDVYDFIDRGNKFTLRHSKERAKIYKKEGFEVLLPKK